MSCLSIIYLILDLINWMVTIFIFDANDHFVNVRDLSEAFVPFRIFSYLLVSFSSYRLLSWPFPLFIETCFSFEILAAFPLLVKNTTQSTIASSVAGVGGTLETDQMIVRPKSRASFEMRDPLPCNFVATYPRGQLLLKSKRTRSPNRTK